jgi:DNA-binding NarL/FixJ family response regulator
MHLLVVDDIAIYRTALADALRREPSIAAVHVAADAASALQSLQCVPSPRVVLVNMAMSDAFRLLRQLGSSAPVIAVAAAETDDDVIGCAEAGASGILARVQPLTELVALIESVNGGESRCTPQITATLLRHVTRTSNGCPDLPPIRLTPRELEVAELLDQGLSNKQIARRLCIELRTVKNHVHHILEKYQVHRRVDAAIRFRMARTEQIRIAARD